MSDTGRILLSFGVALVASLCFTPLARRLAIGTSFLDHPVDYKSHKRATPYLGGLAVVAAMLLGWTVVGGAWGDYLALSLSLIGLCVVGTLDDHIGLGVSIRFVAQIVVAGILWASGLGWAIFESGPANLLVTILWVVGMINTLNLIDSMDGVAAGVAAIAAVVLFVRSVSLGQYTISLLPLALAGVCIGFLRFNFDPARIILGTSGSMFLGFAIAILALIGGAKIATAGR